jgi:hypothetical protein
MYKELQNPVLPWVLGIYMKEYRGRHERSQRASDDKSLQLASFLEGRKQGEHVQNTRHVPENLFLWGRKEHR